MTGRAPSTSRETRAGAQASPASRTRPHRLPETPARGALAVSGAAPSAPALESANPASMNLPQLRAAASRFESHAPGALPPRWSPRAVRWSRGRADIPPTRRCNRRGVSFYPLKAGVRDARVSVEFEIQRHPALISSLTPASECHTDGCRSVSQCRHHGNFMASLSRCHWLPALRTCDPQSKRPETRETGTPRGCF